MVLRKQFVEDPQRSLRVLPSLLEFAVIVVVNVRSIGQIFAEEGDTEVPTMEIGFSYLKNE